MLKQLTFGLTCAGLVAMAAPDATRADQLDQIQARGELICGTLGATRGLSFMDEASRQYVGYEVDLCHTLAERLGVQAVVKIVSPQARIPELEQGRLDVLFADLAWTPERAKVVDYSNPYIVVRTTIMVNDDGIRSFADLADKKISTIKGSTTERLLREQLPGAEIVSFDNTAQAFLAFRQGKVAATATDETRLRSSRTSLGPDGAGMTLLDENLSVEGSGAGVRQGEARLLEAINAMLADLEASGRAEALFMRWFGPGTTAGYESRGFRIDGSTTYQDGPDAS